MAKFSPILKTKFFIPHPSQDNVARKSLDSKFEKFKNIPVMLVSASSGFGKSTTIASFLLNQEDDFTWLSLSQKENVFQEFLRYFIGALQIKIPNIGSAVLNLSSAPEPPSVNDLAELFVNDLADLKSVFYFALDDYHLINNKEIHQFLSILFQYSQPNFKLIIITRHDPEMPLSEWRLNNKLIEIRSSDLKFSAFEIAKFYENVYSSNADELVLSKLEEATGGWISGIRMLVLSVENRDDLQNQTANFNYKNARVIQELVDAVLQNQPEATKDKLLKLSLINEFNVDLFSELCLEESEKTNKTVLFNEFTSKILRSNMFIISLDNKRNWFRFHHLFTELLYENLIKKYNDEEVQGLRLKAAKWYLEQDQKEEAISCYLTANHITDALNIFIDYRLKLISEIQFQRLERVYNLFPENFASQNGILLTTKGWLLMQKGDIPTMAKHIEPLEELLEKEGHPKDFLDLMVGELHAMKAYDTYLSDVDILACSNHSKQAIDLIKERNPYATGIAWIFYGATLQILGEASKARKDIYKEFQRSNNSIEKGQLLFIIAFIEWYECDINAMLKAGEHLLEIGLETGINFLIVNGSVFVGLAHYCQNNNEKALKHLIKANELSRFTYLHMSVVSGMALVDVYSKMGNEEEAKSVHNYNEKLALQQGGKLFIKIAKSAEADLAWKNNNKEAALKWAKENDYKDFLPLANLYSPELVQARLLVLDDDSDSQRLAQKIVNNTIPYFEGRRDDNVLFQAYLIQALLFYKRGERKPSFETLDKAIHLSSIGNYIKAYLNFGISMKELLLEYKKTDPDNAHIDEILKNFDQILPDKEKLSLTQREKEVLVFGETMTNKEVGNQLFISEKTVKGHITNINKKLNVNSKVDAISKAKSMKLI